MKVLAAIANYGTKNQAYLELLLREYRSMAYDVDVVVLSNIPKDLGSDVEVAVGLPSKNPWSLPFAHKRIFADRLNDYDLFIYSEDDTLIQQRHIEAFLEMTAMLPADKIAGFLRYEEDAAGHKYCSTMHTLYHWVPGSVQAYGPHAFAYFTNEHSACYILTRDHLRRAIASGGFRTPPREGRYDMLCAAATDPYTQCGFTKLICISRIQDFMIHHLPNQYLGKLGLSFEQMQTQIDALFRCLRGEQPRTELLPAPTGLDTWEWDKWYYEPVREDVLAVVPSGTKHVLSVGCGAGATEAALVEKGARVVGIPLDAVIAEAARAKGIEVTVPDLSEAFHALDGRRFDCVLLVDILQHIQDPQALLTNCAGLVGDGGRLIIAVPNLKFLKYRLHHSMDNRLGQREDTFANFHLHYTTLRVVARWVRASGLQVRQTKYNGSPRLNWLVRASGGLAGPYLSRRIVVTAARSGETHE